MLKQRFRQKKGVTLVELIVAIALVSIVFLAGMSLLFFGWRNFQVQTDAVDRQNQVRLVIMEVTHTLRQVDAADVSLDGNVLTAGDTEYELVGTTLNRNDVPLASEIGTFDIVISGSEVTVTVASTSVDGRQVQVDTTIAIRE